MGVPKFFRYLSERYPCLSELAREQSIPEFDNLYFDMNGIIHNCSHPDDGNVHFRISEEEMFKDIFTYIDKLFFLIKPKKLFFMAVDGVAPRAKMNQQRSRRFRSAKDAENLEKAAKLKGEKLPEEARFDSNCITPGTEFMVRLQEALQYFIQSKISTDSLWRRCKVILSGHNHPGEGEHKIMDYIRYMKSQNDYDPNTRHCLYGLDADLIILGLASHETHFSLLREEVKFGKKNKKMPLEETRFFLLHLGLLREYLELEFDCLKKETSFDIHNLIDDWILMGFLVGNDFIPHLPNFHINMNALPILYKAYCKVFPELGGNINEHGKLNLERLQKYFEVLGENEFEMFKENHADLVYFQAKQSNGVDEAFDFDVNDIKEGEDTESDLAKMIHDSEMFFNNDEEINSDDEESHIEDEFRLFKRNYYITKLKYPEMTSEVLQEQTECYITALQWILYYYYKGVQSWSWFYPHHYAPFISDMKDILKCEIKFDMGKPFLPFEQLLAVLPAASKQLLPKAFRDLMTNSSSELIEYYPTDFETDLNGKKNEWEAVVLIPFIEEQSLLSAMKRCYKDLTENEAARNSHGPMFEYSFTKEDQGEISGVFGLPRLSKSYALEKHITREQVLEATKDLILSKAKGVKTDVYFPGFPTMKHLKYTSELKSCRVRVFDQPSRNENMILKPIMREGYNDIISIAHDYLDQIVFIGWPHLTKAKVFAISDRSQRIDANGVQISDERTYDLHVKTIKEHLLARMGIEIDDYSVLVHVQTLTGVKYICGPEGRMTLSEIWSKTETVYPAQGLVKDISSHCEGFVQHKKVEDVFTVGSKVFFIGNPYFGSEGVVLDPMLIYTCGRLKISITVLPEPDLQAARILHQNEEYFSTPQLASQLSIMPNLVSRITGTIFVYAGTRTSQIPENAKKYNIALQLRFVKQNEEVQGYTKKAGNSWLFSQRCMKLIDEYLSKFPMISQFLSNQNGRDVYFESDLFPNGVDPENNAENIQTWIKSHEYQKSDRVPCGTQTIEKEAVLAIIDSIEELKKQPVKTVKLQVKPFLLLKPEINFSSVEKPKRPFKLFDRVVVVRRTHQVPLGFKGTIISIHPITDPNPVRLENVKTVDNNYEILFDRELPDGHGIYGVANGRVCKVPETNLVMIFQNNTNARNGFPGPEGTEKEIQVMKRGETNNSENNRNNQSTSNDTSNFWNPEKSDENTKQFLSMLNNAATPRQEPKKKIEINSSNSNNSTLNKDPVDETTNQLKFMLGISGSPKAPNSSVEPPQLPQPPMNWKNDALSVNQMGSPQRVPMPTMPNPPPFYPPGPGPYQNYQQPHHSQKPLVFYTQQLPHFAPQQQLPYVNDNFYSPQYLNQKGAFTPTQVIRCATKNMSKDSKSQKDNRSEQPSGSRLNDNIPQQTKTYFDKPRNKTQQQRQPPPKRRPKIAAKFDTNFE